MVKSMNGKKDELMANLATAVASAITEACSYLSTYPGIMSRA